MITAKIDVTKIEKARLFKGAKGTYLDIVLIDTPNGQYGDYMIVQGVSKDEREKGIKGPILGNGQTRGQKAAPAQQPATKTTHVAGGGAKQENLDEDVPF